MKDLALKLLRKAANYTGGAAAGAFIGGVSAGGVGPTGSAVLLGVVAACMVTETAAEALEASPKLDLIETWLEQLVRQQGSLRRAIDAIVERRASLPNIDVAAAAALRSLMTADDETVASLSTANPLVARSLARAAERLTSLDHAAMALLEKQLSLLEQVATNVQSTSTTVRSIDQKLDLVLAGQDSAPSDDELAARSVDDSENCRLREAELLKLLDLLEYEQAQGFADRSLSWLQRASGVTPLARGKLLERLLDEAIARIRRCPTGTDRSPHAERIRLICGLGQEVLDQLDEDGRLRISSQVACATAILETPDVGLRLLDGRSDPFAVRRRLVILCDAQRYTEAAGLVRGAVPAVEWVDRAMQAAVGDSDTAETDRFLNWAIDHAPHRMQTLCRLQFAELVLAHDANESNRSREAADRSQMVRAAQVLRPLVEEAIAHIQPRHELDACVLRMAAEFAYRLDANAELARVVEVLARRRPLDLQLGVLAIRGRIESKPDWPRRLRVEGPSSFDRQLVAASLEGRDPGGRHAAFRSAVQLATIAATPEDRKKLYGLLIELSQHLGKPEKEEFERLAPSLVDPSDRQARLWTAGRKLQDGNLDAAASDLAELRDDTDTLWLQLHGQLQLRGKNAAAGIEDLAKAARLMDQPELLEDVAGLALAHRQWAPAVDLLERLLVLRPGDQRAQASLAVALHRLGRDDDAARLLRALAVARPGEPAHAVNAAICLVQAGKPDEAVAVLDRTAKAPDASLRAVTFMAQLLVERDQPRAALELMDLHRERFWRQYEFVGAYWSIAFAAEAEDKGHEAFVQMRMLQTEGIAPADVMVEKSIDDVVTMAKAHDERQRALAAQILQGRVPWLLIAQFRHDPAYRAWAQRTDKRAWLFEHPVNLSESTVYCTNWFTVRDSRDGRHLFPIEGPARRQPMVADLSALITLQKLGLLEAVADYCGRFHAPSSYLFKMFRDNDRLRPHQPSRRTVTEVLRQAMGEGRIVAVGSGSEREVKVVDEHYPATAPRDGVYHLKDLADALRETALATDAQLTRLASVAHRPAMASEVHKPIRQGDALCISLSTLSTLHFCDVLGVVIDRYQILVSNEDGVTLRGEAGWFAAQERLRADHRSLWEFLRDDVRVSRERADNAAEPATESEAEGADDVSLHSLVLAERLGLPLLVDDRCVQAARLNGANAPIAFSSAQVVAALAAEGCISREEHARCVRQLIDWRYRFIIPDVEVLTFWAGQSRAAPPGPHLPAVASYLHGCLRDPGLFGGFEPTEPPSTIAFKFHQAVEGLVGEFIGALWLDESFPTSTAQQFTSWALTYLLPSPPASMEPRGRVLSGFGYPLLFSSLLLRLAKSSDVDRARRCLEVVGECLGMDAAAVLRQAVEIIDGISREHE